MRGAQLNLALCLLFVYFSVTGLWREQGQLVTRKWWMPGPGARSVWGQLSKPHFSCEYKLWFYWWENYSKLSVGHKILMAGQTGRAAVIHTSARTRCSSPATTSTLSVKPSGQLGTVEVHCYGTVHRSAQAQHSSTCICGYTCTLLTFTGPTTVLHWRVSGRDLYG